MILKQARLLASACCFTVLLAGSVLPARAQATGAAAAPAATGEQVLIKRPAPLRDAPGDNARALAALPVQTVVTRLPERQGPWIKVRTGDGSTGWLHMFDITGAAPAASGLQNAGANALRGLAGFFNKGSAQPPGGVATSTVGIRGLGAEDLARAQPNAAAVAQADALRVDAAQAQQFARTAALSPRQVEPLPEPASVATPSANSNNPLYSR